MGRRPHGVSPYECRPSRRLQRTGIYPDFLFIRQNGFKLSLRTSFRDTRDPHGGRQLHSGQGRSPLRDVFSFGIYIPIN